MEQELPHTFHISVMNSSMSLSRSNHAAQLWEVQNSANEVTTEEYKVSKAIIIYYNYIHRRCFNPEFKAGWRLLQIKHKAVVNISMGSLTGGPWMLTVCAADDTDWTAPVRCNKWDSHLGLQNHSADVPRDCSPVHSTHIHHGIAYRWIELNWDRFEELYYRFIHIF